ncbi:hypothetical protein MPK66_gp221 [Erwinia phage pEa_SNUABM_2]|uniref:Uncharacterized protein n=1 Tax=Erwinia phage pEa_SNUABM_2 TaxID=2869547 RepID=A0AAE7XPK5_9CAUD|nr:hypothetical protein MPK66_gp221 [Erwinia phage pEa_SNUABM_2]QZE59465.1 hypothetical protein pEaSNUABM2_00221 [Erwinia phage pEa_SNUABM_2]QZE59801.1 hypothetical protein pEaSNUABM39_00221 [Erwinia phage pEa_SNUABM_39]
MTRIKISLSSEANGDMTNKPQPASDIPDSWPDPNKLTGKIPFDPNQSETADDMFDPNKAVEGDPDLRNGNTKPGAEGKASRPDENFRAGGRTTNQVESTHSTNALGQPVRFTKNDIMSGGMSFKDLFGDIFGDIFGNRRVQKAISSALAANEGVSVSKGKSKAAKQRSQMLKMIMPELSREQGERLGAAMEEHDGDTVKRILTQIGVKLGKRVSQKK